MDDFRRRPPMEGFSSGRLGSGRGGELSADDDIVEGHTMPIPKGNPDDQDVEGHGFGGGAKNPKATDDEDVEGHLGLMRASDDDDDTEGHVDRIR